MTLDLHFTRVKLNLSEVGLKGRNGKVGRSCTPERRLCGGKGQGSWRTGAIETSLTVWPQLETEGDDTPNWKRPPWPEREGRIKVILYVSGISLKFWFTKLWLGDVGQPQASPERFLRAHYTKNTSDGLSNLLPGILQQALVTSYMPTMASYCPPK